MTMSLQPMTERSRIVASLVGITLLIAGVTFAACRDSARTKDAETRIAVLTRQTAVAQHTRDSALRATVAATRELAEWRARADSLEAHAHAAAAESQRLAQLVHIASETTLVAQLTPDSALVVRVPRVVTQYVQSLYTTVRAQDSALAARDSQATRADTVIVTQTQVVHADSTVITLQDSTITEQQRARPRFGFRTGLLAGAASVAVLVWLAGHLVR